MSADVAPFRLAVPAEDLADLTAAVGDGCASSGYSAAIAAARSAGTSSTEAIACW